MEDNNLEIGRCPCYRVKRQNSARTFKNPAKILMTQCNLDPAFFHKKNILEIGSGCLRNSQFILNKGHKISVLELSETIEKYENKYKIFEQQGGVVYVDEFPEDSFELIILTFVLETICPPSNRSKILENSYSHLKNKGELLLAVRGIGDIKTIENNGVKCPPPGDGYFTPSKTFIKLYEINELKNYLNTHGFVVKNIFRGNSERARFIEILAEKKNE